MTPEQLAICLADDDRVWLISGSRRNGKSYAMKLATLRVVARRMPGHE